MAGRKATTPFTRQGYHHGNLKEALIAAARELIAERGVAGFTLIDAAKMAGVSAAAPYRHFRDRDGLIRDVAERGFAEFGKRLAGSWQGAERDALAGFAGMGRAYLAFAREQPGYYAAMFSGLHQPTLSGDPAFAGLQHAIGRLGEVVGLRLDARQLAYLVWALSHGIATLAAGGRIPDEKSLTPETLLQAGVFALIRGAAKAEPGSAGSAAEQPKSKALVRASGAAPAARHSRRRT